MTMKLSLGILIAFLQAFVVTAFISVQPAPVPVQSTQKQLDRKTIQLAASGSDQVFTEQPIPLSREVKGAHRSILKSAVKNEDLIVASIAGSALSFLILNQMIDIRELNQYGAAALTSIKCLPNQAWNSYESVLATYPVATKAMTSATVYALGDVLSQRTASEEKLDKGRVVRSMIAGGVGHGPLSHFWYNFSENFFTQIGLPIAWWNFIPKIVVDQTVWGPIWNSLYILLIGMMQKESFGKMKGDIQSNTVPLFLEGLKLWPLAHCVTYGLIPVENRLLWVDAVEIVWVSILATKATSMSAKSAADPMR